MTGSWLFANLFDHAVNVTITATEAMLFDSVRVYISTINDSDINIFKKYNVAELDSKLHKEFSIYLVLSGTDCSILFHNFCRICRLY